MDDIKKLITLAIFFILLIAAFFIIKPFITSVLSAVILGFVLSPIYKRLNERIKKPSLVAFFLCVFVVIIVGLILWLIIQFALPELLSLYTSMQTYDILAPFKIALAKTGLPVQSTVILENASQKGATFLINEISGIIFNLPTIILQIFVMFFLMFYFIRDGESIVEYFSSILPFRKNVRRKFLKRFSDITYAVTYGLIFVGIIQGIAAGIGYYAFGAPKPFFLMVISIFLSFLPLIGCWLVWLPVAISMILSGNMNNGIGLLVYGTIIISWIDNVLYPMIIGKRAKIQQAIALLGMLGGLYFFGIIGLVIGPIIIDYVIIFIEFYRKGRKLI